MNQDYIKPTAPFYQQSDLVQRPMETSDLATTSQVADLKKWIIVSTVSNIAISFGIIGFLIFIYYTLLIEIENGE